MRVLVTGGAGFIGSHTVDLLLAQGHQVAVVDNLSRGQAPQVSPLARFHEADITDGQALREILEQERPEAVVHLAAQVDVRTSTKDPVFDARVNILGSLQVIECAAAVGARKVVFASSGGAIYGEPQELPVKEEDKVAPLSPYGVAKRAVELYLDLYSSQRGLACTSLRYANVYGPRQDPTGEGGVVAIFIRNLLLGRPSRIFGDGEQTRDYVYVGDVAAANVAALNAADGATLHIGSGLETSVNELYVRLCDLMGVHAPSLREPERPGEVRRSVLDPRRAADELHWRPDVPLDEGLARTVEHLARLRSEGRLA